MATEPLWLPRAAAVEIDRAVVAECGGGHAVQDVRLLDRALASPWNLWVYSKVVALTVFLNLCTGTGCTVASDTKSNIPNIMATSPEGSSKLTLSKKTLYVYSHLNSNPDSQAARVYNRLMRITHSRDASNPDPRKYYLAYYPSGIKIFPNSNFIPPQLIADALSGSGKISPAKRVLQAEINYANTLSSDPALRGLVEKGEWPRPAAKVRLYFYYGQMSFGSEYHLDQVLARGFPISVVLGSNGQPLNVGIFIPDTDNPEGLPAGLELSSKWKEQRPDSGGLGQAVFPDGIYTLTQDMLPPPDIHAD